MEQIQYSILYPKDNILVYMEKIRFDAHHEKIDSNPLNTFYSLMIKEGKMLMFAVLKDGLPVAGAYVSNLDHAIFIEHVFVKPEYQNSEYHFGSNLIKYIIKSKPLLELYFKEELNFVRIEYINEKTKHIYQKLHFRESVIEGQLFKVI